MPLPLRAALRMGKNGTIRRRSHLRGLVRKIASEIPVYKLGLQVAARKLRILRKKYHRVFINLSKAQTDRHNADNTNEFLRLTLNNAYRTICALKEQSTSPPEASADETTMLRLRSPTPPTNMSLDNIDPNLIKVILQSIEKCKNMCSMD